MSQAAGTLYVVATPIGNLSDMTPRAISTLAEADMVAAEDTRHSRSLLSHFHIKTPLFSCHAFNEEKKGDFFIRALESGQNVALISDAGTPCISDPGFRLIRQAAAAGITVTPVCGASAVIAALSVSGFDASKFTFIGFWPRKQREQTEAIHALAQSAAPTVFYESPKRIIKTLAQLAQAHPQIQVCLCNDLTKKFERIYRGTAGEVAALLTANPAAEKGEYTCVAQPPPLAEKQAEPPPAQEGLSLEAQLVDIMVKENCGLKDAAARLHELPPKRTKKEIYAAMLRVRDMLG